MDYKSSYKYWLKNAKDEGVRKSLLEMQNNEEEIRDAFYKDLEFGTAGMRGVMAAGTNRINVYTLFRATRGVSKYMRKHGMTSCAITYDSRNNSKYLSEVCAATLAERGIKVYITRECMPTPYLSFMVRNYHTDMGLNITASHNAPQYNGYKVYDREGCQITDSVAREIIRIMKERDPFKYAIPDFQQYVGNMIVYADDEMEEQYKQTVLAQGLGSAEGIKIVYSPLNGAGYRIVPEVLKRAGLSDLTVVPQQAEPDGDFPTCPYPNPESHGAMALAVELAKKKDADAVVANDPDCDRMGAAVRNGENYEFLSGNDVGLLLEDFILTTLSETNALPQNAVIVKTIVTTPMVNSIAEKYGVQVVDVLTGFKYIGNEIYKLEKRGESERFVFGFEESCGYLKGTYVRDKDGVIAALLLCQCLANLKKLGKTANDRLSELRAEFGSYLQRNKRYTFEGEKGAKLCKKLFAKLRKEPLTHLGDSKIVSRTDYLTQKQFDLPKSNVLRYYSEDGSQLIVRPSGTEPIVKCYVFVSDADDTTMQKKEKIYKTLEEIFETEK